MFLAMHRGNVSNPVETGPCEQGNWDTWMVLDPWNQV